MCNSFTLVNCISGGPQQIDSCIADIVKALNDNGITTIGSCCGHGNRPGIIFLKGKTIHIETIDNEQTNLIPIKDIELFKILKS